MLNLLIILSLSIFVNSKCGTERWSVKTATDPDASKINTSPQPTTITAMRSLSKPSSLPANSRIAPTELTCFRINATLTAFKTESDQDYHLVLSHNGVTMIAEIPSPTCSVGSRFAAQIKVARATFDKKLHAETKYQEVNIPVTVEGVGFFDFVHGQRGVAPNGIELHPVLAIYF